MDNLKSDCVCSLVPPRSVSCLQQWRSFAGATQVGSTLPGCPWSPHGIVIKWVGVLVTGTVTSESTAECNMEVFRTQQLGRVLVLCNWSSSIKEERKQGHTLCCSVFLCVFQCRLHMAHGQGWFDQTFLLLWLRHQNRQGERRPHYPNGQNMYTCLQVFQPTFTIAEASATFIG